MIDESDIQKMTDIIVERFAPERIILFGSYAHGTPDEDSDLDLIVVKATDQDLRNLAADIGMSVVRFPVAKDILVRTPEQFKDECSAFWTVFHEAAQDGRVLYERSA